MTVAAIAYLSLIQSPSAEAERIFAACEKKLYSARSLSGRLSGTGEGFTSPTPTFLFQKPNSFRQIDGHIDIYCNGKKQFNHLVAQKEYFVRDLAKNAKPVGPHDALDGFWGLKTGERAPYFKGKPKFDMRTVDGRKVAAKEVRFEGTGGSSMVYLVDPKTLLPIGWDQTFRKKVSYRYSELKLNVPVPPGAFDWTPPPGLKGKKLGPGGGLRSD